MKTSSLRRPFLALPLALAGLLALGASIHAGAADAYPSRPVKILVGYSAGGAVDAIARSVGQRMATILGQPVVVENKPGAGTNIAIKSLTSSVPDGYTLLLAANALAVNPSMYQPAPYDLDRDFTPISMVGRVPVVFAVREGSPIKTLPEFVAAAKAKPGGVTVATPGNGATPHLAMELFQHTAGLKLSHVPYKGGAQAITDVLGGHVDVVAVNALEVLPLVKGGKLKVLAVMSTERSAVLPGVPTVAESGFPGFEANGWLGILVPNGTPPDVIAKLNAEIAKVMQSPEMRKQLLAQGVEARTSTPEQFGTLIRSEAAKWGKIIADAGIKE